MGFCISVNGAITVESTVESANIVLWLMRVIVDRKRVMCEYKKPEKRQRGRRISDIGAIL